MQGDILKGHLDLLLLSAVRSGHTHGYAIIEEVRRRSRGTFKLNDGAVYPALRRLERAGLLKSGWTTHSGRERRIYRLTAEGAAELGAQVEAWEQFVKAVRWVISEAT